MRTSTVILVAVGLAVVLVGALAIAKSLRPAPKTTLQSLIGIAPDVLKLWTTPPGVSKVVKAVVG